MGMIGTAKAVVCGVAGAAIGALAIIVFVFFFTLPAVREAAREAGAQAERTIWKKREADAIEKAEADKRKRQADVDAIERAYHQRTAEQAAQLDIFEASVAQETARVPAPIAADPGRACPAAVPRKLRDALAGVGAAAPRHDPPGTPASVR